MHLPVCMDVGTSAAATILQTVTPPPTGTTRRPWRKGHPWTGVGSTAAFAAWSAMACAMRRKMSQWNGSIAYQ